MLLTKYTEVHLHSLTSLFNVTLTTMTGTRLEAVFLNIVTHVLHNMLEQITYVKEGINNRGMRRVWDRYCSICQPPPPEPMRAVIRWDETAAMLHDRCRKTEIKKNTNDFNAQTRVLRERIQGVLQVNTVVGYVRISRTMCAWLCKVHMIQVNIKKHWKQKSMKSKSTHIFTLSGG